MNGHTPFLVSWNYITVDNERIHECYSLSPWLPQGSLLPVSSCGLTFVHTDPWCCAVRPHLLVSLNSDARAVLQETKWDLPHKCHDLGGSTRTLW